MTTFSVRFGSGTFEGGDQSIAITPSDEGWNDFGFNFHANLRLRDPFNDVLQLRAFILPFRRGGDEIVPKFGTWHREIATKVENILDVHLGPTSFLTLLASDDSYLKLRNWSTDQEVYFSALSALNELTWLLDQSGVEKKIAETAVNSEEFRLGVIRTAGAYRAFRRGYVSAVKPKVEISDARVDFKASFQLAGCRETLNNSPDVGDNSATR